MAPYQRIGKLPALPGIIRLSIRLLNTSEIILDKFALLDEESAS
jgi:hypothetical protein